MNPTNVTINFSPKVKKELTPEQQKKNNFMKMNPLKKWEFVYEMLMKHDEILMGHKEMLMDHDERISVLEPERIKTYKFKSYNDKNMTTEYASGRVKTTGVTKTLNDVEYTEVQVMQNSVEGFIDKKYYIQSNAQLSVSEKDEYYAYQLYEYVDDTLKAVDIWVTVEEVKTYKFKSYSDEKRTSQYASGIVEVTGETKMLGKVKYAEVKVIENTVKEFVGKKYYVKSDAQCSKPVDGEYHVYQLYEYDKVDSELKKVDVWVTIYE